MTLLSRISGRLSKRISRRVLPLTLCVAASIVHANDPVQPLSQIPTIQGTHAPAPRHITAALGIAGAVVPQQGDLASGDTWQAGGETLWNFAICDELTLFGKHETSYMEWANVGLLSAGHHTGVRIKPMGQRRKTQKIDWAIAPAFLTHRVLATWTSGQKLYPGGVKDTGAELAAYASFFPIRAIELEFGLLGRYFHVFTENHYVLGITMHTGLEVAPGHILQIGTMLLNTWRHKARPSVKPFTFNPLVSVRWTSALTRHLGFYGQIFLSANLRVGDAPMLELKRSMIGEPMGHAVVGTFFEF